MDRIFRERMPVGQAKDKFLASIAPITRTEEISIRDCPGRVLATHTIAPRNVPHFRRSAMDGYAMRAADALGASPLNPVMLQLSDVVEEGTCARVGTGQHMPEGADAVMMIEDTVSMGDMIEIRAQLHPGKNVGDIGEDIRRNEILFNKGHLLRACDVGVLASLGIREVKVYCKPVVAIIPVGDDLVPLAYTELPPAGKSLESNSLMIGLYVEQWGGVPRYHNIVPEDTAQIEQAIKENLDADLLIISGGTSVGEKDFVPGVVSSMGELLVHGVGLSPGKPTALGLINDKPVVCIPGYPAAGLVALFVFGRPALRKVANAPDVPDVKIKAQLSSKITSREGYLSYARVILDGSIAHPLMTAGAGILSSIARSQGFVIIPEHVEGYEKASEVDVVLIE
ncbi:molybdopterin molybdotransferase MoeA [uncultured Methanomethylovorans sp.]|uniref:molybdopterin molybdotransferase MoeA n=1 Tax=uncultured Methanomethylovorans sp. TaxID=183759 RepID=UPI0026027A0D|nr:molybdopterin molybdotransferase MoeA [uncultured Methanomethylovorans sp.]